jgi:hypothetical protein
LQYALPEKSTAAPGAGFPLDPNKMIKIDVKVQVLSVYTTGAATWSLNFEIVGES